MSGLDFIALRWRDIEGRASCRHAAAFGSIHDDESLR
jgi:hypothetical protein